LQTVKPDFAGKTVVCIASGPSLTEYDCNLVRFSGFFTIVTNTTFRLCPWADILFAFDAKWWKLYHDEVVSQFSGRKLTYAQSVTYEYRDVETLNNQKWFNNFGNSGACAIGLAIAGKAQRIILLGYDCQVNGKSHWHGDHPQGFSNMASMKRWPAQFKSVAIDAEHAGVEIINASRDTALKCFKRSKLEQVIV
jgi:hypothetical protein